MFGLDGTMRSVCFLLMAFMAVILPYGASSQASGRCDSRLVTSALRELASERLGGDGFFLKSMSLSSRIENSRPPCVTDDDLAILTGWLRNRDDSVRSQAAALIGSIGPAARAAIPALNHALAERPCSDAIVTSADAITVALKKLGETPPELIPFVCRNTYRERRTRH